VQRGDDARVGSWATVFACAVGLILSGAKGTSAQQTSEGHPHKWLALEKNMADFVADGFELKAVVYDNSETEPKAEPDVHYFLQKGGTLVRCDFRKRDKASIYWCYQLTAPNKP
jgi:hypothetical protein